MVPYVCADPKPDFSKLIPKNSFLVIFDHNYKYFIDNVVIWAEQIASAIEAMHNKNLILKINNILEILINERKFVEFRIKNFYYA